MEFETKTNTRKGRKILSIVTPNKLLRDYGLDMELKKPFIILGQ
jgi:hypothetical protein